MSRRHITLILNPTAGRGRAAKLRPELERLLTETAKASPDPSEWHIVETNAAGQATALAAEAVRQGAETVAAVGGDGTLSEVLNGIVGTGAQLAVIPLGTGNDFSRTLGFGTDLPRAVQILFHGLPKPIDLGNVHNRWFLNIAGCGFDAVVAERVNRGFRRLHGSPAYIAALLQSLLTYRPAALRLTLDGAVHAYRAMMCSVANAQYYGGGMRIAPDARLDDGLFDLCIIGETGTVEFLRAFPRVFRGTHTTHPKVTMRRAREVTIESDPTLPVFLDGDLCGTTPATFTLAPRAIEVLT